MGPHLAAVYPPEGPTIERALSSELRAQFDGIARLASRAVGAPVGLVSFVDAHVHHFAGAIGLPDPWQQTRTTPLSHSFCRHVVATRTELVVEDARDHAQLSGNLAIRDLGVVAYAGVPLHAADGSVVGSVCAIDEQPRAWTQEQLALLYDAAALAGGELQLLASRREAVAGFGRRSEHDAVVSGDTISGLIVVHRLLDELTRTAETARASQLHRGRTIAHELKTPLVAARMLCDDLAAELGGRQASELGLIDGCIREAMQMLDAQVADSTTPWATTPRTEPLDVGELFATLQAMMQPLCPPAVALRIDPPPTDITVIETDPVKLGQVLRNLIVNALRITDYGQVRVSVHRNDDLVRFTVADTGPGVDEAMATAIFDEGFRGHRPGSFGLGLPLSRSIMRGLGGDLTVTSTPGRGARFEATLPA